MKQNYEKTLKMFHIFDLTYRKEVMVYMEIIANNIKIHYEVIGEGKPIVLLNPNTTDTSSMKFIAKALATNFKVYLMDRRCCGKSERNCELSYEKSAKDVIEFIRKLNLDKPYLLGSSGGAIVAMYVALAAPDIISKLVCCSGVAHKDSVKKPLYATILEKLPYYPGKKENEMFEGLNNGMKDLDEKTLNKISVPTLVVNGGNKDIVPKSEAMYIAENIPNAELLILEKEGHFSYMINCKWYKSLKNFLEGNA